MDAKMQIRSLLIFLFSILSLFQFSMSQNQAKFVLDYASSNEEIHIRDLEAEKVNIEYRYDNPTSATPSLKMEEKVPTGLTKNDLRTLKKKLKKARFWKLKEELGAPKEQRFYPYSLHIKMGDKEKTVIFRSNPDFEDAPKAFWDVVGWARTALGLTE